MQVIFNSCLTSGQNYNSPYKLDRDFVSFKGRTPQLQPLSVESFSSETAKKLYSKIQKYFQLIGEAGHIENVKILNETSHYRDGLSKFYNSFDSEADIFLSINKKREIANLSLSRKYKDTSKGGYNILDMDFDQNGQMIRGKYPLEGLHFERTAKNARRIYCDKKIYLPQLGNDRAWEHNGRELLAGDCRILSNDDSTKGAFEIFLELARLRTSIYK